jgi:hypothetical protein
MHWPNGQPVDWREHLAAIPPRAERPSVDPDLADRTYRALLARLQLSNRHRDALHRRGFDDEQIARRGYGTGPTGRAERQALAEGVTDEVGEDLVGRVPGFVRDRHGQLELVCGDDELLIPVRDTQDRIVGIRRRLDTPGDGGKYRWLSGGHGERGGIGVDGSTVHVATPRRRASAQWVVIVEGELKADLTADRFGCLVLSVPGVGNIGQVVETLHVLGDVGDVAIAYDEDGVADASPRLA